MLGAEAPVFPADRGRVPWQLWAQPLFNVRAWLLGALSSQLGCSDQIPDSSSPALPSRPHYPTQSSSMQILRHCPSLPQAKPETPPGPLLTQGLRLETWASPGHALALPTVAGRPWGVPAKLWYQPIHLSCGPHPSARDPPSPCMTASHPPLPESCLGSPLFHLWSQLSAHRFKAWMATLFQSPDTRRDKQSISVSMAGGWERGVGDLGPLGVLLTRQRQKIKELCL